MSFRLKDIALLWSPGTGKTAATINILRAKYAINKRLMRTFVFTPPAVLRQWKREFAAHSKIDQKDILVLSGTGGKRTKQLTDAIYNPGTMSYDRPKIILGNYEIVQTKEIYNALMLWNPEILVCDESHKVKNHQSKRAQLVAKMADKAKHKILLTGTPILNSSMDLFQQFRVLDMGETFGKNFFAFRATYFEDENAAWAHKAQHFPRYIPRASSYENFQKKIYAKATRITKEECLDLPPLLRETRDVEMGPEQAKAYQEMRDDFLTYIKAEEASGKPKAVVAQLAITKALRLQQICSGYAKTEAGEEYAFKTVPRLKVLEELLEEITGQEQKVIVWACFKQNYRAIGKVCDGLKLRYSQLHGGLSAREKDAAVQEFTKDEGCKVMIANQKSGGVGLNLVEASYSVYFSKTFSLEDDLQSEARNYRGGSEIHKKITRIDLVTPNSIDELITEALKAKQNVADLILNRNWRTKI